MEKSEKQITHCIAMVTYNHEKYIRNSLDSLFAQEVIPNKIIIFDDCSTDNTWDIIKEYKKKYPAIIDCNRNKTNLGIFQNINNVNSAAVSSGCDIISSLSGDDYFETGILKAFNSTIITNNIDVINDSFIIISNSSRLYQDGSIEIVDNYKNREEIMKDFVYSRITNKIDYRNIGISRNVFAKCAPYRYDLGINADLIFTLNMEMACQKFYFIKNLGACYRLGVGISSKTKKEINYASKIKVDRIILNNYDLSKKAKKFLLFDISYCNLKNKKTIKNILLYFLYNIYKYNLFYIIKSIVKFFIPYGFIKIYNIIKSKVI